MGYTRAASLADSVAEVETPSSLHFIPDAPKFGTIHVPGLSTFGPVNNHPDLSISNTFQFASDTLLQMRVHALKWGIEVHRYRWDSDSRNGIGGQWSFNSLPSFLQGRLAGTSLVAALPGSNEYHAYRQRSSHKHRITSKTPWTVV